MSFLSPRFRAVKASLTCGVMVRKMACVMMSTRLVNIRSLNSKSLKCSNFSLS